MLKVAVKPVQQSRQASVKKKIINLAISAEADTRLRGLSAELSQPLGVVLELAILAYQPDRTEPEPTWQEMIEARLNTLESGKIKPVAPVKNKSLPDNPGKGKRLPDSEFDRLVHTEFVRQHGVIRNIPPALRAKGIAVSQKRMMESLKRLGLKG